MFGRIFALFAVVVAAHSLTLDREATEELVAAAGTAQNGGEIAILLRAPHGKSTRREELLNAKGEDDAAVSLFYNRKSNKVSLETLHGGHLKSVSWGLGAHSKSTLLLVASSNRVRLYVGCHPLHWHSMTATYDILDILRNKKLKLYHEESVPVEIFDNEKAALDSMNCGDNQDTMRPPTLLKLDEPESDVEEVKDFIEKQARKKDEELMQGDQPKNGVDEFLVTPNRGDIPQNAIETCDDEVIRQLTLLRQTIENLRREIADQKGIIDSLRGQLHQCCNRIPVQPPVDRCTGSSCYPGY